MKFFQSEVVQKELTQMQDLYMEINKMGLMLNLSQKREQLDKMMRLIELQQTMYMRVTLSEDPEAKKLVDQVKNAASMLGMPCLLYTSPSPRDTDKSRMPSSA